MNQNQQARDYFTKETTTVLKGIFAVAVLIHHLFLYGGFRTDRAFIDAPFATLGTFAVSVFFFITGYGLAFSISKKGKAYLDTFPKKRILPVYGRYLFFVALYTLLYLVLKLEIPFKKMALSFLWGETIVKYGWYFQVVLLFYLVFWLCFKFLKEKGGWICFALFSVLYFVLCYLMKMEVCYYFTVPSLSLGMEVYLNRERFWNVFEKRKPIIVLVTFCLTAAPWLCGSLTDNMWLREFLKLSVSSFFFALLIYEICLVFTPKKHCRFLKKTGEISFEIYASQGMFFLLFRSSLINVENRWLYCLLIASCTIVFSVLLHKLLLVFKQKIQKQ